MGWAECVEPAVSSSSINNSSAKYCQRWHVEQEEYRKCWHQASIGGLATGNIVCCDDTGVLAHPHLYPCCQNLCAASFYNAFASQKEYADCTCVEAASSGDYCARWHCEEYAYPSQTFALGRELEDYVCVEEGSATLENAGATLIPIPSEFRNFSTFDIYDIVDNNATLRAASISSTDTQVLNYYCAAWKGAIDARREFEVSQCRCAALSNITSTILGDRVYCSAWDCDEDGMDYYWPNLYWSWFCGFLCALPAILIGYYFQFFHYHRKLLLNYIRAKRLGKEVEEGVMAADTIKENVEVALRLDQQQDGAAVGTTPSKNTYPIKRILLIALVMIWIGGICVVTLWKAGFMAVVLGMCGAVFVSLVWIVFWKLWYLRDSYFLAVHVDEHSGQSSFSSPRSHMRNRLDSDCTSISDANHITRERDRSNTSTQLAGMSAAQMGELQRLATLLEAGSIDSAFYERAVQGMLSSHQPPLDKTSSAHRGRQHKHLPADVDVIAVFEVRRSPPTRDRWANDDCDVIDLEKDQRETVVALGDDDEYHLYDPCAYYDRIEPVDQDTHIINGDASLPFGRYHTILTANNNSSSTATAVASTSAAARVIPLLPLTETSFHSIVDSASSYLQHSGRSSQSSSSSYEVSTPRIVVGRRTRSGGLEEA